MAYKAVIVSWLELVDLRCIWCRGPFLPDGRSCLGGLKPDSECQYSIPLHPVIPT